MTMSISANGGNGLANLFRQGRPVKPSEERASGSEPAAAAVSLRPAGRSGIDSTGSGTAQVSAALTLYMSDLGEAGEGEVAPTADRRATGQAPVRSAAAELMRVLDAYGNAA